MGMPEAPDLTLAVVLRWITTSVAFAVSFGRQYLRDEIDPLLHWGAC